MDPCRGCFPRSFSLFDVEFIPEWDVHLEADVRHDNGVNDQAGIARREVDRIGRRRCGRPLRQELADRLVGVALFNSALDSWPFWPNCRCLQASIALHRVTGGDEY